jgi:hypothetical protein
MRETESSGYSMQKSAQVLMRILRLSALVVGIGLVITAGTARAQEDEEDEKTFEEKIIDGLMAGIGGTNMENRGIDYRERSPLVVPPKLTLPPPASASAEKTPNWPKDPDEARRKAAIAARKKENKDPVQASRLLTPAELNAARTAPQTGTAGAAGDQPGNPAAGLTPSQLGYTGGFSGMFGGSKTESAPFKGEPTRDSLTQPPPGYQTPSPNYLYGTGPKESLNKQYDPVAGK